jgi:uncharacterized repeat protein (TIGR04138 family)
MQQLNFDEVLETVLAQDARYSRDAYHFLREALDHTQKAVAKARKGGARHVTGKELLEGIREFSLKQFGPMTLTVFHEWGVRSCEDFGNMVFNLVGAGLLSKTKDDTQEDFRSGYDFEEVFRHPFLPRSKQPPAKAPKPASA